MHAEYTAHSTNRSIFYVHMLNGAVSMMRVLFFIVSPISFDSPISVPVSPSLHPTDGLPITEHWHQMCSSSVDSGTSWAECASGSVNENGCAVCVCAVYCGSVACDSWGTLCGWGFREWATASCTAVQLSHAVLNSKPTKVETIQQPIQNKHTHTLSLSKLYPHNIFLSGSLFFICRAVSHNPHPSSYIIIYSFL